MRGSWSLGLVFACLAVAVAAAGAGLPQDDAGSGEDAPGEPVAEVWIEPGRTYEGTLEGYPSDMADHYAFQASAGDEIEVLARGTVACVSIEDGEGSELASRCPAPATSGPLRAQAPSDGTYFLAYTYYTAQRYGFGLGVNEPAANPSPVDGPLTPQDDATSGRDAPDRPAAEVWIEPDTVYDGTLEGALLDPLDHYAFEAEAGDRLEVLVAGSAGCVDVLDAGGDTVASQCVAAYTAAQLVTHLPADGTYLLRYHYDTAQLYRFSFALDDLAPRPFPTTGDRYDTAEVIADVDPAAEDGDHTVLAVVDTGINPYHRFFAASDLDTHPSQWLEGFPADAQPIELTLDAGSYEEALAADEATWDQLERSDLRSTFENHLYTVPGTRVLAGISFGEYDPTLGDEGRFPVLDEDGHGTGSAGLAAGARLETASGNVLIVAVEVGQGNFDEGLLWAARQPWIDAITASIGTVANVPYPTSPLGGGTFVVDAVREARDTGKPVYVASGNGFSSTGVAPDHCTTYTSPYTGPPHVTRIGAADPRSGNPSTWHCVPVDAIAGTPAATADHDSLEGAQRMTGTSAATPHAIGFWAELEQRAREDDLDVKRGTVNEHLLRAAEPAEPAVAPLTEPSTSHTAPLDQGYGLVDGDAMERAWDRMLAQEGPAERPTMETWLAVDDELRRALWGEGGLMTGEALPLTSSSAEAIPHAPVEAGAG